MFQGWKLPDMMFATKRGLSDACNSIAKQLENVYASISVSPLIIIFLTSYTLTIVALTFYLLRISEQMITVKSFHLKFLHGS